MGRKPAPQPLALSESALPPPNTRDPAETLQVISPADSLTQSKSPRSPRSPFRFGDRKTQVLTPAQAQAQSQRLQATQQQQQPMHVADLVQHPLDEDDEGPRYPPISAAFNSSSHANDEATTRKQQAQIQQQQQQQRNQQNQQNQQNQRNHHQQQSQQNYGHNRHRQNEDKASRSNFFFHFGKSSKSTERLPPGSTASSAPNTAPNSASITIPSSQFAESREEAMSRGAGSPSLKQGSKSSGPDSSYADHQAQKPTTATATNPSTRSDVSLSSTEADPTSAAKRGKPKSFALLGRSRSVRDSNGNLITTTNPSSTASSVNNSNNASNTINSTNNNSSRSGGGGSGNGNGNGNGNGSENGNRAYSPAFQDTALMKMVEQPDRTYQPVAALKTAPVTQPDRAFRDMSSAARNHSADRAPAPREIPTQRDGHRGDRGDRDYLRPQPSSYRENGGGFFGGLKSSSRSAADIISKGLFGKSSRSGSTNERDPVVDDEHYVIRVINQPLVDQTRLTRISKRLEDSRDKTEFWMPAFPWRAIDYLNYKGTDVEGLYRVPGSGPQIKKWQRRFDEEYDVDLFAQEDLYDINIIGSMLKAWLRELPDELFPKDAQERIARECAGAEKVPQMLVDELSNLSPFNYYLLFAITCHLSLLLAHSDKNKMDFRNLCICFQPCMKIDAFSFKFLVCDWRDCWKGCRNEARYIEEEYKLFDMPPPASITARSQQLAGAAQQEKRQTSEEKAPAESDKRNVSSSDSSKQSHAEQSEDSSSGNKTRSKKKTAAAAPETGSVASNSSTVSTTLTADSQRLATPPSQTGDLRPLSPIKPLSPLGF